MAKNILRWYITASTLATVDYQHREISDNLYHCSFFVTFASGFLLVLMEEPNVSHFSPLILIFFPPSLTMGHKPLVLLGPMLVGLSLTFTSQIISAATNLELSS